MGALTYCIAVAINNIIIAGMPLAAILLYPFILLAMFCGFLYWNFFMMLWLSPLP